MADTPQPRWVVTDADAGDASWHDAIIHGVLLDPAAGEIAFDLDWPLRWVAPEPGQTYFRSWAAPATLVFHGVVRVETSSAWPHDGTIIDLGLDDDPSPFTPQEAAGSHRVWLVKTVVGYWRIAAMGFAQYSRQLPVLVTGASIGLDRRGGVSFARTRDITIAG